MLIVTSGQGEPIAAAVLRRDGAEAPGKADGAC
jgi:hypothetical protein